MITGGSAVVLNWSKMDSLGYSSSRRQGVAAHEPGHLTGLAHISAAGDPHILMYPYDNRTIIQPSADDKAGISALS